MNNDILMDRIRAHRSAPDVYDPPTFEDMADRIMKLEAMLDIAFDALNDIACMDEGNVTAYIQKVDVIALDALAEIGSKQ